MPRLTKLTPCTNQEMETAEDYKAWLLNDDVSWNNQRSYIVRNLLKKLRKGIFDPMKSIKLFIYLTDRNKTRYYSPLPCNVRYVTAVMLNAEFIDNIEQYKDDMEGLY